MTGVNSDRVESSAAPIYVIAQGRGMRERELKRVMDRLADVSGGRAFFTDSISELPGVFAEILRDADEPDARLAQAAHMHLQREMIPGKPAEGMHENDLERRAARGRYVEQALQFRAAIVRAAHAGLDEFYCNVPAARGAIGERLPPLVRDR